MDELSFMLLSEKFIYDIHVILRGKRGIELCPLLQKIMEMEEVIYEKARNDAGLDGQGVVWSSNEAIREYKDNMEKIKKKMTDRDDDWDRLFKEDARKIIHTLFRDGPVRKRQKVCGLNNISTLRLTYLCCVALLRTKIVCKRRKLSKQFKRKISSLRK